MKSPSVSNEDFIKVFEDETNQKILNTAGKAYKKYFQKLEFKQVKMMATWKAILGHKDGAGQKFTSSLYQHMLWQCKQQVHNNYKLRRPDNVLSADKLFSVLTIKDVDSDIDMKEEFSNDELQLIDDVFKYGKKIRSVAIENGITIKEATNQINNLRERLQCLKNE